MKARVAYRKLPAAALKAVEQRRAVIGIMQIVGVFEPAAHKSEHRPCKLCRDICLLRRLGRVQSGKRLLAPTELFTAYRKLVKIHQSRLPYGGEVFVRALKIARFKRGRGAIILNVCKLRRGIQRPAKPLCNEVMRVHVLHVEQVCIAVSEARLTEHHKPRPPLLRCQCISALKALDGGGVAPAALIQNVARPVRAERRGVDSGGLRFPMLHQPQQREAARREMLLHSCVDTGIRAAAPVCRRLQDRNVRRGRALQQRGIFRSEGGYFFSQHLKLA